jgi:hypothetical protein
MSKTPTFFDVVSNINEGSRASDLLEGCLAAPSEKESSDYEKAYNSFMINRALSFFQDSILFANEMNIHHSLPPKMCYDFLRNSLRPRKRFSKWFKSLKVSNDVELIKLKYGYSTRKAEEALEFFDDNSLSSLREEMHQGGKI